MSNALAVWAVGHVLADNSVFKLLLLLMILIPLLGQSGCEDVPRDAEGPSSLRERINKEIRSYEESAGAVCGVYIIDLRDGQTVTELRIDKLLKPGSNMKLLTSAFALGELGPDFEFTTSVYLRGKDIVVVGDGDSTLGAPEFVAEIGEGIYTELDRWVAAVKEKARNDFTGDLIICSEFDLTDSRPPCWTRRIYRFSWAPATGGLNYHENLLDVMFDIANGTITPHVKPESRFFKVVNKLKLGDKEDVILHANGDDSQFELTGTLTTATKGPVRLPVNQPELFTGRVLAERLVASGVPFEGEIRFSRSKDTDLAGAKLLYRKKTPIAVTMKWMNKRSLNMPAECHYLRTGGMTWQDAPDALTQSLTKNYGMEWGGFVADEGSGISSVARIAPREIVRLLKAFLEREGGEIVVDSLPRSGIEGTMKDDLTEPEYRGRVLGKIGHVLQGYCLSGYVLNKQNKPVMIYSIMANAMPPGKETEAKPLQSNICKMLVDYVDGRI